MMKPYLQIFALAENRALSSFDLYLPAGDAGDFYTCYHFVYEVNAPNPTLGYGEAPNNPANRRFYRIKTAFVCERRENGFAPLFRALQGGEIGLAFREEGAGDFVGGYHGDEVLTAVSLTVDGRELPLCKPFSGEIESFSFSQDSIITRCNTPLESIISHKQCYTVSGDRLLLSQSVTWIADARPLTAAFMPMLTAQRLDPEDHGRILTDTVAFYGKDGETLTVFDTSSYGADGGGSQGDMVCKNTPARSVRVFSEKSGFSAEAGYTVRNGSIPDGQQSASLWIRYMKHALDNKVYFDIGKGTAPKAGTVWESDVYYRVSYQPKG